MDPHPLANLFKRSNYVKHEIVAIAPILDSSFDEKHDCNDVIINSLNVNCVNDMQNLKLTDANFAMTTICCNDHDQGDSSYNLENLFKPHDEYEIDNNVCNNIESGFEECQLQIPHIWRMFNLMKFLIKVGLERS